MSEPQNWNSPYYCRLEYVNSTKGAENESRLTWKTLKRDNALGRLEGKEVSGIQGFQELASYESSPGQLRVQPGEPQQKA